MAAEDVLGDLIVNVAVDATGVGTGMDDAAGQIRKGAADMGAELDGLGESAKASTAVMSDAWSQMGGGAEEASQTIQESLRASGAAMVSAGEALTAGITVPLTGLGAAALEAGNTFNTALMSMEQQTGATGEALAGMQDVFKNVFTNLPVSAKSAADAIAEISQRMDLAGPALEAMSTQMLNLAHMTGEQVEPLVRLASRAFNQWEIDTTNQSRALDQVALAARQTGIPIDQLLQLVTTFGPALRETGSSFTEAIALIATLDKAGVNVQTSLAGMRQALLRMGKAGIADPVQGMQEVVKWIDAAGSAGDANERGLKVFGRGASDLVDTLRRGVLDGVAPFAQKLQDSTQTINQVANDTRTLGDRFTIFGHTVKVALDPIGETLLKVLEGLFTSLKPVIEVVGELAKAFSELSPFTQGLILSLAALAAAVGPVLAAIGLMATGLAAVWPFAVALAGALGLEGGLAGVIIALQGAVSIAAGAFIGWELGTWLRNNIPFMKAFGDMIGDLILKIPLLQSVMDHFGEGQAEAAKNAAMLDFATNKLEASLKAHGITVDKTGLSTEQYAAKLRAAASEMDGAATTQQGAAKKTTQSAAEVRAALDALVNGADKAISAVKAIPFKDLAPPELVAQIQAVTNAHQQASQGVLKFYEMVNQEKQSLGLAGGAMDDFRLVTDRVQETMDFLVAPFAQFPRVVDDVTAVMTPYEVAIAGSAQAMQDLIDKNAGLVNQYNLLDPQITEATDLFMNMKGAADQSAAAVGDALNGLQYTSAARQADLAAADAALKAMKATNGDLLVTQGEYNQQLAKTANLQYLAALAGDADVETLKTLKQASDDANNRVTGNIKEQISWWDQLYNRVLSNKAILADLGRAGQQVFRDLSTGIADVIVDHKKFSDVLKQIEKDLIKTFIETGLKVLARFALEGLAKVLAGFGGISDALSGIAGKMGGVFGGGGGGSLFGAAAGGIAGIGGDAAAGEAAFGPWSSWAGSLGEAGSAGGSAAGGIGGALSGTLGSVLGFAGLGVSIVSGIVSGIQQAHANNLLGEIEKSTRGALAQLIVMQETSFNKYLPYLIFINEACQTAANTLGHIMNLVSGFVREDLDAIAHAVAKGVQAVASTASGITYAPTPGRMGVMVTAGAMASGSSYSMNNFVITDPDVVKNANALIASLKRAGLKI